MRCALMDFLTTAKRKELSVKTLSVSMCRFPSLLPSYLLPLSSSPLAPGVSEVAPHPPDSREHDCDPNRKIKTMKQGLERWIRVPLLAEFLTHVRQSKAPWQRTDKGVDDKL